MTDAARLIVVDILFDTHTVRLLCWPIEVNVLFIPQRFEILLGFSHSIGPFFLLVNFFGFGAGIRVVDHALPLLALALLLCLSVLSVCVYHCCVYLLLFRRKLFDSDALPLRLVTLFL